MFREKFLTFGKEQQKQNRVRVMLLKMHHLSSSSLLCVARVVCSHKNPINNSTIMDVNKTMMLCAVRKRGKNRDSSRKTGKPCPIILPMNLCINRKFSSKKKRKHFLSIFNEAVMHYSTLIFDVREDRRKKISWKVETICDAQVSRSRVCIEVAMKISNISNWNCETIKTTQTCHPQMRMSRDCRQTNNKQFADIYRSRDQKSSIFWTLKQS